MRRVVLLLSLAACGCLATPLAHPLRANDGFAAETSATMGVFSGHARERADVGFSESSGFGSATLSGSLGYAHVFGEHLGAMAGVYAPAMYDEHNLSVFSSAATYSFFTYQIPLLSVGAGPELGYGGAATTMGFELGPWDGLTAGAYARWFWPFVPASNISDDHRSHDFGVRLRRGMVYAQYGFYSQMNGLFEFYMFGDVYRAHAYHLITLGLLFDASTIGSTHP